MFLKYFALLVLLVLGLAVVVAWVAVGMAPGKIARQRNHPQAEAIGVCGWWGVITLGILCPLAFIWAYTNPMTVETENGEGESK
jgi:amino acid transporter